VWLNELAQGSGHPATLDDIPDVELDRLSSVGFDWVWLLGAWQTGPTGRRIALSIPELRRDFEAVLPDLKEEDICGSCFAISDYSVHSALGGNGALQRLYQRLHQRNLRLMLDFVPNHTAPDHAWVQSHPEYYISGTEQDLRREPNNYCRVSLQSGTVVMAYGRDPYFPGWSDTLQLNYGNPALQEAMMDELFKIAGLCDGVRCDMAMLILPEIFLRTWGIDAQPFWPMVIPQVRQKYPGFMFLAEVYWDLEWTLQQQGFDFTYDKRLYDRLRERRASPVREHFLSGLDYQDKLTRFLENHDEPRAATVFPIQVHKAAAALTFLSPGMRFFHQGQLLGRRVKIPVQLCRAPSEPVDADLQAFYDRLLSILRHPALRDGDWQLLLCIQAEDGNRTREDCIAFSWQTQEFQRLLVAVNFAPEPSQCTVRLPFNDLDGGLWVLTDLVSTISLVREGNELATSGLHLDMPGWGYHVFELRRLSL
jgi:glycosidase